MEGKKTLYLNFLAILLYDVATPDQSLDEEADVFHLVLQGGHLLPVGGRAPQVAGESAAALAQPDPLDVGQRHLHAVPRGEVRPVQVALVADVAQAGIVPSFTAKQSNGNKVIFSQGLPSRQNKKKVK